MLEKLSNRTKFYLLTLNFILLVVFFMSKSTSFFPWMFSLNFFCAWFYLGSVILKKFNKTIKKIGFLLLISVSVFIFFITNGTLISYILILIFLFFLNLNAISVAFVIKYRQEEGETDEDEPLINQDENDRNE